MRLDSDRQLVPLPAAAVRLRMTWGQVYNAMLAGRLVGLRRGTRWYVTDDSVARLARDNTLEERAVG